MEEGDGAAGAPVSTAISLGSPPADVRLSEPPGPEAVPVAPGSATRAPESEGLSRGNRQLWGGLRFVAAGSAPVSSLRREVRPPATLPATLPARPASFLSDCAVGCVIHHSAHDERVEDLTGAREQLSLRGDRLGTLLRQQTRPSLLGGELGVVRRRVHRHRQPHARAAATTAAFTVPGDHVEAHVHKRRRRRRLQCVHAHRGEYLVKLGRRDGRVKGEPLAESRERREQPAQQQSSRALHGAAITAELHGRHADLERIPTLVARQRLEHHSTASRLSVAPSRPTAAPRIRATVGCHIGACEVMASVFSGHWRSQRVSRSRRVERSALGARRAASRIAGSSCGSWMRGSGAWWTSWSGSSSTSPMSEVPSASSTCSIEKAWRTAERPHPSIHRTHCAWTVASGVLCAPSRPRPRQSSLAHVAAIGGGGGRSSNCSNAFMPPCACSGSSTAPPCVSANCSSNPSASACAVSSAVEAPSDSACARSGAAPEQAMRSEASMAAPFRQWRCNALPLWCGRRTGGLVGAGERIQEGEEGGLHGGLEPTPRVETQQDVVEELTEYRRRLPRGLGELGKSGDEGAGIVRGRDAAEQVAELHQSVGAQQLLLVARRSVPLSTASPLGCERRRNGSSGSSTLRMPPIESLAAMLSTTEMASERGRAAHGPSAVVATTKPPAEARRGCHAART
eukprot:scaffold105430_cov57-Phaeocystis_antarctica.AAC.2